MICENWIWLPTDKYPDRQTCCYSDLESDKSGLFTVAEFKKDYSFEKKIKSAKLRFSADTALQLYVNGVDTQEGVNSDTETGEEIPEETKTSEESEASE